MHFKPFISTLFFFILSIWVVLCITDTPLNFNPALKQKKISAIAIRDNVSAFEKRGSALFTIPYLRKYYSDFTYLEAEHNWISSYEFVPPAEKLLKDADSLDIYILSHGNLFYQWFGSMDTLLRKKIRLVYNTGCDNDSQCTVYKNYGIKYYVGHTGENSLSPVFYFYFLRRMFSESSIETAVAESNKKTENILNYFVGDKDTVRGSLGNFHEFK